MRSVALPLILGLAGIVAAQALPSSAPSTGPTPDTAPASLPASAPASGPASLPSTDPSAATFPTTGPDSRPSTQAATGPTTSATTGPASTMPYASAASGPAGRPFSSYSSYDRGGFRSFSPTTSYASAAGGPDLTPKPYPRQYSAMLSRSIFIKGRQTVRDNHIDPNVRPSYFSGPTTDSTNPAPSSFGIESVLVFNGASDANGQLVAFVENTGMNQITRYHLGDPVGQGAQGKISAITLDSIDYQAGARVTHVNLGQNLNGQDVQILTTQPVAAGMTPTTGPAGTTQPATPGGAGTDSVIERLRRRRMQELGQ
jgi:hypothetical protein